MSFSFQSSKALKTEAELLFASLFLVVGLIGILSLGGCKKKTVHEKSTLRLNLEKNSINPIGQQNAKPSLQINPAEELKKEELKKQKPPQKTCFTFAFHHKPVPSHNSDDICTEHGNLIRLGHAHIHEKSLCVRVDGTPVSYQILHSRKKELEVLVGPFAGPKSIITARYCLKGSIQEECKIPKDHFMEAMGLSADGATHEVIQDDKATLGMDSDIERELSFSAVQEAFADWMQDKREEI